MNKQRKLKRELGEGYCFTQNLSVRAVECLMTNPYVEEWSSEIATLEVGVVRLDAMLYLHHGNSHFCYELLVKDRPENSEWLCYESLSEPVQYDHKHLEREMFRVLDEAVERFGLSYTQCRFPVVTGGEGKAK